LLSESFAVKVLEHTDKAEYHKFLMNHQLIDDVRVAEEGRQQQCRFQWGL
jgi:hypothetical protein